MTTTPEPPSVLTLTYGQSAGWNCVWCGERLGSGAVSAGIARGHIGAHDLSVEVYACPAHADGPAPEPVHRGGGQ